MCTVSYINRHMCTVSYINRHMCTVSYINRPFLLCSLVTSESGPSPYASTGVPTLWPEVITQRALSEASVTVEVHPTRNKVPPLPGELTATQTNSFCQVSRSASIPTVAVLSLDICTRLLRFRNVSCFLKLHSEEGQQAGHNRAVLLELYWRYVDVLHRCHKSVAIYRSSTLDNIRCPKHDFSDLRSSPFFIWLVGFILILKWSR
jgi:hypothetical protein